MWTETNNQFYNEIRTQMSGIKSSLDKAEYDIKPSRERETIEQSIDKLIDYINSVDEKVQGLRRKIDPVLLPNMNETKSDTHAVPTDPNASQIKARLDVVLGQVLSIGSQIDDLYERCDL